MLDLMAKMLEIACLLTFPNFYEKYYSKPFGIR